MLVLLCFYMARSALRSHQWQSEKRLFTSALSVCPLNAKVSLFFYLQHASHTEIGSQCSPGWLIQVHYNVGKNLADQGNTTAAIEYYREAVRWVHSSSQLLALWITTLNSVLGHELWFSALFRLHPTYVHAMNNLGNIMKERNELIEAEQLLTTAVAIQ